MFATNDKQKKAPKQYSLPDHEQIVAVPQVFILDDSNCLKLDFYGNWIQENLHIVEQDKQKVLNLLKSGKFPSVSIDLRNLKAWDISFIAFITHVIHLIEDKKMLLKKDSIPSQFNNLLKLALVVPKSKLEKKQTTENFFESIGEAATRIPNNYAEVFIFIGEIISSFFRIFAGKAKIYMRDFVDALYECSVSSLGIILLTSLLLGLILAFVSIMQLRLFGAEIFVASFVTVSMVRIMGALLTGIVIAGRTGARFSAIIGTMQVNEEIDALKTFGISPYDFLVLPRFLALTLMLPLLSLFSSAAGVFGGYIAAHIMMDMSLDAYFVNALTYMRIGYVWIGLSYAFSYGLIIGIVSCYQGIHCGRSAEAVGTATTAAVVTSIVGIIIATACLTIVFTIFKV